MAYTLVIGNKNYSSWSLRPWLFMKQSGVEFEEAILPLYKPEFAELIARYSPAGRVPVLLDGALRIWDSLAICEHVNETVRTGWPEDKAARALARAISAEMHSGFQSLRGQCPLNARARGRRVPQTPELLRDVRRIDQMWKECRERFGSTGPWLFGRFSIADAMYAPVVLRFNTYGAELSPLSRQYATSVLADPHLGAWLAAAQADSFTLEETDAVGR